MPSLFFLLVPFSSHLVPERAHPPDQGFNLLLSFVYTFYKSAMAKEVVNNYVCRQVRPPSPCCNLFPSFFAPFQ